MKRLRCALGLEESSSSQKVRTVSLKDKDGQEVFSGLSQAVVSGIDTNNSLNVSDAVTVFDEPAASKDNITSRHEVADQAARAVCKDEFVEDTPDFSVVADADVFRFWCFKFCRFSELFARWVDAFAFAYGISVAATERL